MFVLDHTALAALLNSQPDLVRLWRRADASRVTLGIPATAVVEAADLSGVNPSAWDVLLWPARIRVLPLGEAAAKEIGGRPGSVAARHAVWESQHLGWPIITRNRSLHGPDVDVRVV